VADATPADMRDWGLVPPEELERIVIVSPHLDDAALSCAYLMTAHPATPVVTVFAGRPAEYPTPMERWDAICGFVEGDEVHVARRAEDQSALSVFEAQPVWLDFVEHSYLAREEWVRPADIVDALEAELQRLEPTAVFIPFGLGNPDHDCTHEACLLVRERATKWPRQPSWFCYEDTGYKHIPGLLAWRVTKLMRAGLWPTPAAVPIAVDHDRKLEAYHRYPSQVRALEQEWNLSPKLAAPAPEQYWRLAPPPEGWEGLAR
jgi:LmbE family N-acetylglucosaminyl deacetylase